MFSGDLINILSEIEQSDRLESFLDSVYRFANKRTRLVLNKVSITNSNIPIRRKYTKAFEINKLPVEVEIDDDNE